MSGDSSSKEYPMRMQDIIERDEEGECYKVISTESDEQDVISIKKADICFRDMDAVMIVIKNIT